MAQAQAQILESFEEEGFDFENLSNVREEEIRSRLDTARDEFDAMPESEAKQLRLENVKLELEVYRNEHDNTGAYKFKRFGAEMGRLFLPDNEEEKGIEQGTDGAYKLDASMENRRVIFVDMLELDRLNKEGGSHDVGDEGLNAAAEEIKALAGKHGDFQIFRSGGNQFMLDMENMSDEEYDKLMDNLSNVRVTAKEGLEPAPLVANGVNFRDAIEDVNLLNKDMESFGGLEPHEAAREMTGLLMRSAEWGSEIKKLTTRANRVREMLEKNPKEAKEFFDNYVKKTFQETPYNTIDDFKKLIDEGTFDQEMRELAFDQAHARFEIKRTHEDASEEEMHKIARKRVVWDRSKANQLGEAPQQKGEGLAEIPKETRGESILHGREDAVTAARVELKKNPSEENKEMVTRRELELQLERARRDGGTGLLERGVYYEDLENDLEKGESLTAVFVDMGFLKYFDKQGGRDVGNNGIRLAASLMEEALIDAGVEGEAYRYGGDEFTIRVKGGEQEAKKFLNSLEKLNEQAGAVPAGAKSKPDYVPTGLQFSHGMVDTTALNKLLSESGEALFLDEKASIESTFDRQAEKVAKEGAAEHAAMKKALKTGVMPEPTLAGASLNKTFKELGDFQSAGMQEMSAKQKAELMTRVADTGVQYLKAADRFEYLLEEMENPDYHDPKLGEEGENAFTKQLESKIAYSNKALFSELGGDTVLRVFANELRNFEKLSPEEQEGLKEEIDDQIRRFVIGRVDAAREKESTNKRLLDQLVESRTRISYLEELSKDALEQNEEDKERIKEIEGELEKTKKAFAALTQVRKDING